MNMDGDKKMDALVALAKRRAFVYPDSDIYGGFANAWDFGPYGIELKNNIRDAWWNRFVHGKDNIVGVETPIIQHPKIWEASGHLDSFHDPLVECKKCHKRFRADHLLETKSAETGYDKEKPTDINVLGCPACGGELTEEKHFSLMFKTSVGVTEDTASDAYLRPETAAGMFTTWRDVRDTMRQKVPFGIAQIGKAFRNEITPGNFIFRLREFEQMEIEYFVNPDKANEAFDMWLEEYKAWNTEVLRLNPSNLEYVEIGDGDRAFYSARSIDPEYKFPFGQKELGGLANRTDHDLSSHQKASGQDLRWFDQETGKRYLPHVIEPTWGLTRCVLAVLSEHVDIDDALSVEGEKEARTVLRFPPKLAPVKVAVLPLMKKDGLPEIARELVTELRKTGQLVEYDEGGSIGKRYRRQDEIGTPWCITIDPDTKEKQAVTIRERDEMTQETIALSDVPAWFEERMRQ